MSHNETAVAAAFREQVEPVGCNKCGWTGYDADLEPVSADSQDGEPSRPCPQCRTDHYLMDLDEDPASTLGNEMVALLRRIGEASVEVGRGVAKIVDRHRDEPSVARAIGELSEVFEIPTS